jgi:hypothetical protein
MHAMLSPGLLVLVCLCAIDESMISGYKSQSTVTPKMCCYNPTKGMTVFLKIKMKKYCPGCRGSDVGTE